MQNPQQFPEIEKIVWGISRVYGGGIWGIGSYLTARSWSKNLEPVSLACVTQNLPWRGTPSATEPFSLPLLASTSGFTLFFFFSITRDPHRFPSEIAEAQCRYSGCINSQGQEDSSMNSVAIQQEILVLRREPQGCPNSFRLEKMRVKVGCTCVTPIVRRAAWQSFALNWAEEAGEMPVFIQRSA